MPKTRILTAIVLLGLALLLLWRGTLPWVLGVFAAIALRAAWEWAGLCSGLSGARRWLLLATLGACLAGSYALPASWTAVALAAALAWWALGLRLVLCYPVLPDWIDRPLAQAAIILLALAPAWLALARLADGQRPLLLLCLALVWAADSGAYLVGRRFGKRKLCPQVSPGKTVEGLLGGLVGAVLVGLVAGLALGLDGLRLAALVGLVTACAAVSVVGDLAESLFKRRAGVKDSSHLLPGHGGVLDRIDALIAAAPLFALTAPLLVRG
ncbi:phosphatidate cytidylyltransferase [Immundisolibacter sp.]|uniref:phosphatidate cytidylyltransferase n=1 Tax=Immundisolibacter sp. TaxID=1934948 RepID=UPI0019C7C603|nr:phosphatidate cytidylyltransferase [Immundisolibacter sp.]MBC7161712.1 phosphatidate cytidylyltransferase [Immundisolibacter sp.]MEA3220380.1 Phosphatidate cytidylyltransferase [Immundisolibacter sp.]